MIEFLVYLLVLCLVFGLIYYALGLLPVPPPFKNIVMVILILIFILLLLGAMFGTVPLPRWPRY
jgi:hypothetical protein